MEKKGLKADALLFKKSFCTSTDGRVMSKLKANYSLYHRPYLRQLGCDLLVKSM